MAITVVSRPQGRVIDYTSANQATLSGIIGSTARFTTITPHGLTVGDYVYIVSNVRDYSGFWYVDDDDANNFACYPYPGTLGAVAVNYINNDTVTVYKTTSHTWSSVHLPIVYKLSSGLWPTNTVDTVRTVSSSTNLAGYTRLTVSGDIKATGSAQELDFVKLNVNGLDGIYQIIQWTSDTVFMIDLAYLGTNVFGNIQFYYNNYHARIKIYAGLKSTHTWTSVKPYEYLTEIKQPPDADNIVNVNINEYVKSQIDVLTNDLLLGTLPNNTDGFCQYYITVAESFDQPVDGYTIGSYVSSYSDDSANFEGVAINAKLPFKNVYSGFMSDYVAPALRKFLTLFAQPTLFNGYYFEVDFIIDEAIASASLTLKQETYKAGVLQNTYTITLASTPTNYGVWRQQLSVKGTEDQQKVYLYNGGNKSEVLTINVNNDCASQEMEFQWLNYLGGFDQFVFTSMKDYGIELGNPVESSKSIMSNWPASYGETADTINREIQRDSNESVTIYSQNITQTEIDGLVYLKTSPLVQIITSRRDKRTVLIDKTSFVKRKDGDKLFTLQFKATYTDFLASQSL